MASGMRTQDWRLCQKGMVACMANVATIEMPGNLAVSGDEMPKNEMISAHPFMDKYTKPVKRSPREIVGRKNEMMMLEACLNRPELCNAMLLGEAGSGKACSVDTLIPVADSRGYIRLGDIRLGDMVFNEAGEPVTVLGVYPQGSIPGYRVTFTDGSSVICNSEHLWNVRTRKQHHTGRPYRTMTLEAMMEYGIRHVKKGKRTVEVNNWYVPAAGAVGRPEADLPLDPYALGALIGDGSLADPDATVAISSVDRHVIDRVAEGLGAGRVYDNPANHDHLFYDGQNQKMKISALGEKLADNRVFGFKSIDRRIPEVYFTGSVMQRLELLRGLMDTDGTVVVTDRTNCSFATSSNGLAADMQKLAASLGFHTSLTVVARDDGVHINDEYTVHFRVSNAEKRLLFSLPRHLETLEANMRTEKRNHKRFDDIAVCAVEDLHKDFEMVCIYVSGPSHLFQITERHIVTHNTMLVQGTMAKDVNRHYVEVNLAKMIADYDPITLGNSLTQLFAEVDAMKKELGKEVVLFIDEFHQIVQLSPAAVEAMKPLLADSGTRGVKVIAATTFEEFRKYIAPNQPLVERLQRINLNQPGKEMTVSILKGMARQYGVDTQFYNDSMYEAIYELTNRYVPANSQPRKSILVLDAMVGWHRATGRPLDRKLLADVIYQSEGVNIAFRVDANNIKKNLDAHVYAQELASSLITNRLHIAVADLNDKSKPMASFLFTGSTGVGKGCTNDTMIPVWTPDGSVVEKRNGDLQIGDYVFNRLGKPVRVVGVFPRGMQDIYEVSLSDGRKLYTDSSHLWTYLFAKGKHTENTYTNSTKELFDRGVYIEADDGRRKLKYWIPMNHAVEYPEADLKVHPYVMGAFIGDGSLTVRQLTFSSSDEDLVARVANLLGNCTYEHGQRGSFNWKFPLVDVEAEGFPVRRGTACTVKQSWHTFKDYPEVCGKLAPEKRIPKAYMYGSVEQRWELVRGLFDTDGSIGDSDGGRYNVSFSSTSFQLIEDLQQVLYSLGVASTWQVAREAETGNGRHTQYRLNVKSSNENKERFFWLERKRAIARKAAELGSKGTKASRKSYDWVGISDIKLMPKQAETTCIYVDDDEHLYQAGQYIVTHNTEMTKQLASILFGNDRDEGDENQSNNRNLIRFDMTEYANKESLERFRSEITARIWEHPYCVLLLDEIEKACAEVTRLLLQVLDDGRLSDENGRQVTFTNCYIVLTTNAGSEIYRTISQYNQSDTGDGAAMKRYNKLIRQSISQTTGDNRFPPELLGRIDAIIPFQPLSEETMRKIVKNKILKLIREVSKKHNVELRVDKRVVDYLVLDNLDSDSNSGGARIVVTKMIEEVTTPVARFINENPDVRIVGVAVEGDMAWEHKDMLQSEAYIKVAAYL